MDGGVSVTIRDLLAGFFAKNENRVMIYVCDTSDGRGKQRSALFKKWYATVSNEYSCDNIEIDISDSEPIYGAILRRIDFPHNLVLKSEVIDRAESIILEKFGQ